MTLHIQHGFAGPSGAGDDHYINTFHISSFGVADFPAHFAEFVSGTSGPTFGEALAAKFRAFYVGHATSSADNPVFYMSKAIGNIGEFLKVYDGDAAPHSPPVFEYSYPDVIAGMSSDADSLPWEVALTVSVEGFHTGVIGGTGPGSKARRRNRFYVGPWNTTAIETVTGGQRSIPNANLVAGLAREYYTLLHGLLDDLGFQLVVYSRADTNEEFPTRVWVDNAWDTQRRRGDDPTSRFSLIL